MSQDSLFATAACPYHPEAACTACPDCLAAMSAELTDVGDRYRRLLSEQSRHDREVYAAAWRSALDQAHAFGDQWAASRAWEASHLITALIHQVNTLVPEHGGRVSEKDAHALRWSASGTESWMRDHKPDVTFTTEETRASLIRLRAYITEAGRKLHAGAGPREPNTPCRCAGCELIRGMDAPAAQKPVITAALAGEGEGAL